MVTEHLEFYYQNGCCTWLSACTNIISVASGIAVVYGKLFLCTFVPGVWGSIVVKVLLFPFYCSYCPFVNMQPQSILSRDQSAAD